jgi:uncharacterized LabA/DUF88 family protein
MGVRAEVMGFKQSTADELVEASDSFIDMADREETFLL